MPPVCIISHLGAVGGLQNVASCEAAARTRLLLRAGGRVVASGSPLRSISSNIMGQTHNKRICVWGMGSFDCVVLNVTRQHNILKEFSLRTCLHFISLSIGGLGVPGMRF